MSTCSSILGRNAATHGNEPSRSNQMNMHRPGTCSNCCRDPRSPARSGEEKERALMPKSDASYIPSIPSMYFTRLTTQKIMPGQDPGYALLASNLVRTGESMSVDVCDSNPCSLPSLHNNRQSLLASSNSKYLSG